MLYIFFLISWQCHNEIKTHFNVFFNCCPWLFIHNAQVLAMQQMVTLPFVISSSSVLFKSQTSNHHISFINKSSIHNYQGWQPMMYAKDKMIHHHPGVVKRILHRDARNCTSFTESKPLQNFRVEKITGFTYPPERAFVALSWVVNMGIIHQRVNVQIFLVIGCGGIPNYAKTYSTVKIKTEKTLLQRVTRAGQEDKTDRKTPDIHFQG